MSPNSTITLWGWWCIPTLWMKTLRFRGVQELCPVSQLISTIFQVSFHTLVSDTSSGSPYPLALAGGWSALSIHFPFMYTWDCVELSLWEMVWPLSLTCLKTKHDTFPIKAEGLRPSDQVLAGLGDGLLRSQKWCGWNGMWWFPCGRMRGTRCHGTSDGLTEEEAWNQTSVPLGRLWHPRLSAMFGPVISDSSFTVGLPW